MNCVVIFSSLFVCFWCFYTCQCISNFNPQEKNLLTNEGKSDQEVENAMGTDVTIESREKENKKRETWQNRRHSHPSEGGGHSRPEYLPFPSGPSDHSGYGSSNFGPPQRPHYYDVPPNDGGYHGDGGHGEYDFGHEYSGGHHEYNHHEVPSYEGGNVHGHGNIGFGHKGLALKKILLPLAGLAILGAVAALSTNPVLLQLGTIGGRRRRRRSVTIRKEFVYPANPKVKPS